MSFSTKIYDVFLLNMLGLACLVGACSTNQSESMTVQLAKASQALHDSAKFGSHAHYEDVYTERDPNPNATVGALLYDRYCTSCHGNASKAPPILGNYATTPESESDFYIIRYGLNEMRGFSTRLTNFQVLDILAYLQAAHDQRANPGEDSKTD